MHFDEFVDWFKVLTLQNQGDMSITKEIVALSNYPSRSARKVLINMKRTRAGRPRYMAELLNQSGLSSSRYGSSSRSLNSYHRHPPLSPPVPLTSSPPPLLPSEPTSPSDVEAQPIAPKGQQMYP